MEELTRLDFYSLNNNIALQPVAPIIRDRDPRADEYAPNGTPFVNNVTENLFLRINDQWVDMAGAPGTGNYTSMSLFGENANGDALTITAGNLNIAVGNLIVQQGDIIGGAALTGEDLQVTNLTVASTVQFQDTVQFPDYPDIALKTGAGGVFSATPQTDGDLLIGSNGGPVSVAKLTSNNNSLGFTYPAPGVINIEVLNPANVFDFITDSGTAQENTGVISFQGGSNCNTAGAGNAVTINLDDSVTLTGSASANTISSGTSLTVGVGLAVTAGDLSIEDGVFDLPASVLPVGSIASAGVRILSTQGGANNLFVGGNAGTGNPTGTNNTGFGVRGASNESLRIFAGLTTGTNNTAAGIRCLRLTSTQSNNTALGLGLASNNGSNNTATSGGPSSTASNNTSFGPFSLTQTPYVLNQSVILGNLRSQNIIATQANVVLITNGADPTPLSYSGANTTRIGFTAVSPMTACYIGGIYGATYGATNAAVIIDSADKLGTTPSSLRYKENVRDMGALSEPILKLKPRTFNYKKDKAQRRQYGLVAEEVAKDFDYLVNYNDKGQQETVRYHELPVMILNELQKAAQRVEALEHNYLT